MPADRRERESQPAGVAMSAAGGASTENLPAADAIDETSMLLRFRARNKTYQGKLRPGSSFVVDHGRAPAQPNQSVIDSVRILQALSFSDVPRTAVEVARQLDLEPIRAHRLLRTLALMGMAYQTTSKKLVAGPGIYVMAAQSLLNSDLAVASKAPLDALHRETGLEVALGMLWQDYVSYIYHASPDMPLEIASGQISMFPASMSSLGQLLMSDLSDQQIQQTFEGIAEIPGFESTGLPGLMQAIAVARQQGYARVRRPTKTGQVTIAVKIPSRPFAAIGIGGDLQDAQTEPLVQKLRNTVAEIDQAILQMAKRVGL